MSPNFTLMNEWYKQLFGESEGKDNKGLFPASCIFSTDLHSMGQFIQEGSRIMFETIVDVKKPAQDLFIDEAGGQLRRPELPGRPEHERGQPQGHGGHHPCPHRRRRARGT